MSRNASKKSVVSNDKANAIAAAKLAEQREDATTTSRKGAIQAATPEQLRQQVADLIDELRAAMTVDDKKRIRRALRARGHRGGLRVIDASAETAVTPPTPADVTPPTKKSGKRAKKAVAPAA